MCFFLLQNTEKIFKKCLSIFFPHMVKVSVTVLFWTPLISIVWQTHLNHSLNNHVLFSTDEKAGWVNYVKNHGRIASFGWTAPLSYSTLERSFGKVQYSKCGHWLCVQICFITSLVPEMPEYVKVRRNSFIHFYRWPCKCLVHIFKPKPIHLLWSCCRKLDCGFWCSLLTF